MNLTPSQIDELRTQVQNEYSQGYTHVRDERNRKQDILKKVMPLDVKEGEVKVHLLWRNIQLENSLFLSDDLNIIFNAEDGVISDEMMEIANKVAKFDYIDMDMNEMDEDIVNHNALYGVSVSVIDGYDTDEEQPISQAIDPLLVIPDPKNYRGSRMRFIGFEGKVTKDYLRNLGVEEKTLEQLQEKTSFEQDKYLRKKDEANNLNYVSEQTGLYDIYSHFTVFNNTKYLTRWGNNNTLFLGAVEIEPLTEGEKKRPNKVKFPVQIHRRKPIYGSFFGAAIADEVLQYQDSISILVNLVNLQARLQALGPDKYIDNRLGVNLDQLSQHKPGGRIIPADAKNIGGIGNGIYVDQQPNISQAPGLQIQSLYKQAEDTTGVNALSFGQTLPGSQTKSEVQTLMQNANQLLSWIGSNYMKGKKDYWEAHYRSYALNMSSKVKKSVSFYADGRSFSKTVTKKDFVSDGKVQVYIESKAQKRLQDDKDFAKLISLANLYLGNMKPGYAMNEFLRKLGDKLGVDGFISKRYITETVDEVKAKNNLTLLNQNVEISDPVPGEDLLTYINIYRQAMDTPAKWNALEKYEKAYIETGALAPEAPTGQTDSTSAAMAMNQVSSQTSQSIPSIQNVAM